LPRATEKIHTSSVTLKNAVLLAMVGMSLLAVVARPWMWESAPGLNAFVSLVGHDRSGALPSGFVLAFATT